MGEDRVASVAESAIVAVEERGHGPPEAPRGTADHVAGPPVQAGSGAAPHAQCGVVEAVRRDAPRVGNGSDAAINVVG